MRLIQPATVDGILISYGVWNNLRMGTFSLHISAMQAFITSGRISELNASISASIIKFKVSKSVLPLRRALSLYRKEHRHLLQIAGLINDQLFSRLIMVAFLTIIFNNVMMIAKLIFELPLLSTEAAVAFMCIFFQTVFSLIACDMQITWAKALYSGTSIHLLYISQPMLRQMIEEQKPQKQQQQNSNFGGLFGIVMLIEKLKLNLYFELVCTRKPFIFTLGQLGGISKKSLYEV